MSRVLARARRCNYGMVFLHASALIGGINVRCRNKQIPQVIRDYTQFVANSRYGPLVVWSL
jgi:hypothetical protein